MANPTSMDNGFATLAASAEVQTLNLNSLRQYMVAHDNEDVLGAGDLGTIIISTIASIDADSSAGANRAKLLAGRALPIGPGVSSLSYVALSGAPTFLVTASPYDPMIINK